MIVIRPARHSDAAGVAFVHQAAFKDAYHGLLDRKYLSDLNQKGLTPVWTRHLHECEDDLDQVIMVAASGPRIVGFVLAGRCREPQAPWQAEVFMVYVLKEQRGGGVGRTLMKAAADHYLRRGLFSCGVWVLRDNGPARDFYEALQGEPGGRKIDVVAGQPVPLVSYAWKDVAVLADRATPYISIGGR